MREIHTRTRTHIHPCLLDAGPNINMVKDPRYGRNSELAGEDPFLTGVWMGV